MKNRISRRDFLKLSSLFLLSGSLPHFLPKTRDLLYDPDKQNVLIFVFDSLSALDVPFLGFSRNTTPHLSRIIKKATVYHNHYSAGNFTSPGTASLLTGTDPWTHRAIKKFGTVTNPFIEKNIFNGFDPSQYYRFAYTHNAYAERLLTQFEDFIEHHIPLQALYLDRDWIVRLFSKDYDIALLSSILTFQSDQQTALKNSLFLPDVYEQTINKRREKIQEEYSELFPRGLPNQSGDNYFLLEDCIDFLIEYLQEVLQPFMGYFHIYPPHFPYNPPREFTDLFVGDKFKPAQKPDHIFANETRYERIQKYRLQYHQHVAYADAEFARLYDFMEESGLLQNTWLVITSDHGEMFERSIFGHITESLHEPVVKIPLIIVEPGQTARRDVYTPTSSIDVLPTLLHQTGQPIPDWIEGNILPPYQTSSDPERSIYIVEAKSNRALSPLTKASVALIKGQYKLHAYFGYDQLSSGETLYEFYDLKNDPEELENLYSTKSSLVKDMQEELHKKLEEVNKPYL